VGDIRDDQSLRGQSQGVATDVEPPVITFKYQRVTSEPLRPLFDVLHEQWASREARDTFSDANFGDVRVCRFATFRSASRPHIP